MAEDCLRPTNRKAQKTCPRCGGKRVDRLGKEDGPRNAPFACLDCWHQWWGRQSGPSMIHDPGREKGGARG